jgi:PTS system ascorbate-specific IIA component
MIESNKENDMLQDFLNRNTIAIHQRANDKYEAIRLAGALLEKQNLTTAAYTDEMISTLDSLGPYIVLSPGIAFAHARPGDYILEDCVSMVVLDTPVAFGNQRNDPVRVLFAIGARDNKHHLSCMRGISKLICREGFVDAICALETMDEVLDYINASQNA